MKHEGQGDVMAALRNRAKLPKLSIHKLRHTTATWLIDEDLDLYSVQGILRHSSAQVTERYAHLQQNRLRQQLMQLSKSGQQEAEVIDINARRANG